MGRRLPCRIHNCVNDQITREQERNPHQTADGQLPESIPESEIWAAVQKIHHSRALSGCNRLTQLLDFVVSSTLRGESAQLKETTIGVYVFARSPDYDPKVDTIVRSQAWRLRAKLRKYYATEGAGDSIVIELPIGHYVPSFHVRREAEVSQ